MSSRTEQLRRRLLSAWAALLCLAATATAAAPVFQEGEYFRPRPPDASGRVGTSAAYRRSPCPAINALANHGYIARDGKAITAQALKAAAMKHFNVDARYADTLVALAKKPVFDLNELSTHNVVEHDMSLVHKDAFFGQDPAETDAEMVADFFGHVGAAGVLDPWFFARTQQRRLRDCMASNPQCEFSNEFLLSVTLGRQGLLMRVMGGRNEEVVDVEAAKMLLIDEKLAPTWTKSTKSISQNDIQNSRKRLFGLLQASGEWLGDGFGTTSQQLVADANVTQCLQVTEKTVVVSSCDSNAANQKFLLDRQQRLVVSGGGCIQVETASNASSASVIEAACSENATTTQRWWYDASGRLRPVQTPSLCVDLQKASSTGSSFKVTVTSCATRPEQRFFSFYSNFQPSVSRLASINTPRFCLGLDIGATTSAAIDLSPVVVTPCDTMDDAQELTLDETKRLVFAYDSTQCVDVGGNDDSSSVFQKPCSDATTKWRYDSLSRLHPTSSPSKCLQFPGENMKKVTIADCVDGLAQKWYIFDTKNADIRPADQYYRPNMFEASGKPGTSAAYSRSPCPALNTLANHGFLPRSGRYLTAQQVIKAVVDHFNIDPAYAQVLVALANRTVFNLDDLSIHNAAEHDMSLVHADAFFGQDPAVTDPTLAADLFRHVGSSGSMDVLFFARTQARRLKDCQARNPQCDFGNEFLMSVALGRLGLLMRAIGGRNGNLVDVDRARAFLVDEKFPADFIKSVSPITQANIQQTRKYVYALLSSSAEWLVDGFLNSKHGVSVVSEGSGHTLCLEIAQGSSDAHAVLVIGGCDASKSGQNWLMDDKQRIVNQNSGLCLAVKDFGTQPGTAVVQVECAEDASNQLWTYDSSGRLRPAHAASMCLDVDNTNQSEAVSGANVILSECDATSHQRFYSIYDRFQPNVSHLTSIQYPELCLTVVAASLDDNAPVEASACDPAILEQQLTMDTAGRLVFAHSEKCLTLAEAAGSTGIVQAACKKDTNQFWKYDSLGRLHPASIQAQCVELTTQSAESGASAVFLADCSDAGVQRWYTSDAKDPNNRPENAYYRPNRDESSGQLGTTATYSRSPCPAINALANHGIINRDGRNISRIDLIGAAVATFNIEAALAEHFMTGITDDFINLDQLSSAGMFEYKGSLLHSDAFFSPDPAAIEPDLVSDLFARVGSDSAVDLVYFAAAQRRRLDNYAKSAGVALREVTLSPVKYMKPGLVLRVVGGKNEETASADVAKLILVEERIPETFLKPASAVTLSDASDSAGKVRAMLETGGASSSGEGGTSASWLSQPFMPKREPIYALRGGSVSCLSLANGIATLEACNSSKPSQLFVYDDQQRLIVEDTASCLDVIDGKLGSGVAVGHVDCTDWPHQKWTYDFSGRLHPHHGPKFCLSVATGGVRAVITKCSDSTEQRFFASFGKLTVREKQLVSVALTASKEAGGSSFSSPGQLTQCLSTKPTRGLTGLGLDQCNDADLPQLFSLDDAQRLIPQGTTKCVVITDGSQPGRSASVTQFDCGPSPDSQAWAYDSLGRMHLRAALGFCLAASGDLAKMEPCSTAASQRWVVARFTSRKPSLSGGGTPMKDTSATASRPWRAGVLTTSLLIGASLVL